MLSDEVGQEDGDAATNAHPAMNQHIPSLMDLLNKLKGLFKNGLNIIFLNVSGGQAEVLRHH